MTSSLLLVLAGCPGPMRWSCPTDAEAQAEFSKMKEPLARLQQMLAEDDYAVRFLDWYEVVTDGRAISLSRKAEYFRVRWALGDVNVSIGRQDLNVLLWGAGATSKSNCRYKSLHFVSGDNKERKIYERDAVPSLDGLERQGQVGLWVKALGDGWFIMYLESD